MRNLIIALVCFLMAFLIILPGISQSIVTITGEVEVVDNGEVFLLNALTRDTLGKCIIKDHHFNLEIGNFHAAEQALPAMIICHQSGGAVSAATGIAIENTPLTVSMKEDGFSVYTGSKQQEKYTTFLMDVKEIELELYNPSTGEMYDSIQNKLGKTIETFYLETRNTNFNEFASLVASDLLTRKFINPEHLPSLLALCKDSILMNKYDHTICEAIYLDSMHWIGKPAPDFSANGSGGEKFQLADKIGSKTIVLDFWASWCGPCIREMPELKELYGLNQIEIIGISIDDNKQAWLKSLAKLNLPWINTLDEGKSIANLYNVIAVPTKIVIDKSGIIVARNPENIKEFLSNMK